MSDVPRISNGPQILCRMCGEICNHFSGLCRAHRREDDAFHVTARGLSKADRAYLDWKRKRDEAPT